MNYQAFFVAGTLMAVSIALPTPAEANIYEYIGNPIAQVTSNLQGKGYFVQLNGNPSNPLGRCVVTGVHGLRNSNIDSSGQRIDRSIYSTVYLDFDCLG